MRGSKILRAYPVPINSGDLDKIKVTHVTGGKGGKDGVSCTHEWNGTVLTVTSASGTSSADLKGNPGKDGKDGISPSIYVEKISGGHRVTITDANGTQTFDVMNGTSDEAYDGNYAVTPKVEEQTMLTKGKVMLDDITVREIPYFEVSNTSGGDTVYIADEI